MSRPARFWGYALPIGHYRPRRGAMMRSSILRLCFFGIFCAAGAASAAPPTPTDTYIYARDRYVAAFKDLPSSSDNDNRAIQPRNEVERLLRLAVPAWRSPGFSQPGEVNLSSLDDDALGFSVLNGLVYRSDSATVLATNRSLLRHWLADQRRDDRAYIPVSVSAAFGADEFWTSAFGADAAAQLRSVVPVNTPPGAEIAITHLAIHAQYVATERDADTLLVAVMRGERVFIAEEKLAASVVRPTICKAALDRTIAESNAALEAYQDTLREKRADTRHFKDYLALEEKADRDYRTCFAQHLREQPHYAAIQKQAQHLVDLLQ